MTHKRKFENHNLAELPFPVYKWHRVIGSIKIIYDISTVNVITRT